MADALDGLERLIGALRDAGLDPEPEEVAESIWLAARISIAARARGPSSSTESEVPHAAPERIAPTQPQRAPTPSPGQEGNRTAAHYHPPQPAAEARLPLFPYRPQDGGEESLIPSELPASPFRAPGVSPLPQALSLSRALRPLRRRIPSRRARVLDLEATVERIADRDLWQPVTRPRPEPWLDLDLLVDQSGSMVIWQPAVHALRQLLLRQDAFGRVRLLRLCLPRDGSGLAVYEESGRRQRVETPSNNPLRRRLSWFLTDDLGAIARARILHSHIADQEEWDQVAADIERTLDGIETLAVIEIGLAERSDPSHQTVDDLLIVEAIQDGNNLAEISAPATPRLLESVRLGAASWRGVTVHFGILWQSDADPGEWRTHFSDAAAEARPGIALPCARRRLPWIAIRALIDDLAYCFGDDEKELDAYAWFGDQSESASTHAVGRKKPNVWDLYDMHGNVWEWCEDWYAEDYTEQLAGGAATATSSSAADASSAAAITSGTTSGASKDPSGPESGSSRVVRGGSWGDGADGCRSAYRISRHPGNRSRDLGFRLSRTGPLHSYPFTLGLPDEKAAPVSDEPEEPTPLGGAISTYLRAV